MDILIIAAVVMLGVGLLLGLAWQKTIVSLLTISAAASLLICLLASLIIGGPPDHWSIDYLLSAAFYLVFPYLLFFLAPIEMGAVAGYANNRLRKKPQMSRESQPNVK